MPGTVLDNRPPCITPGVVSQEQEQVRQRRTGSGGVKAVRESSQEKAASARGMRAARQHRQGACESGVTAGSMWLSPERRRQEVLRVGFRSHRSRFTQGLDCHAEALELHRDVRGQGWLLVVEGGYWAP